MITGSLSVAGDALVALGVRRAVALPQGPHAEATALVRDQFNRPVANVRVTFVSSAPSVASIDTATALTDNRGIATATVRAASAGNATVTATAATGGVAAISVTVEP